MLPSFKSPLPNKVALGIACGDVNTSTLHPSELEIANEYKSKIAKLNFTRGRLAAKQALSQLGLVPTAVGRSKNGRAPIWPRTIVGSISHCNTTAVALVSSDANIRAVGVDIEELSRWSDKLKTKVFCADEISAYEQASDKADMLIASFALKEALFKAINPIVSVYFGYHDAKIIWSKNYSQAELTLTKNLNREFKAGWSVTGTAQTSSGLVMASVIVA